MPDCFDALIVGGGPAGAFSALQLARLGWRTALIERGGRNRNKTCGHCLNARAIGILNRAGLCDAVRSLRLGMSRSLRVHWPGHAVREFQLCQNEATGPQEGWLVARHEFDQVLIDTAAAAGVRVLQPASARGFRFERHQAQAEVDCEDGGTSISASLIIGADGVGSAVARAAGACEARNPGRKYGFSFDFKVDLDSPIAADAIGMFVVPGGYLGAVRYSSNVIHVAALVGERDGGARNPLSFVQRVAMLHPTLAETGLADVARGDVQRLMAVGPMPWRTDSKRIAGDSYALVGDAAGYVEPFTGEGMSWALRSAELLADTASSLRPGRWNRTAAERYMELWNDEIRSRHRSCSAMAFALEHQWLSRAAFCVAGVLPNLTRGVIRRTVSA